MVACVGDIVRAAVWGVAILGLSVCAGCAAAFLYEKVGARRRDVK